MICQYCNNNAMLINSKKIYGIDYGMMYYCKNCGASVGVHKKTLKPLGTLANQKLRELRKKTHRVFDRYWKGGKYSRAFCYNRLATKLDIDSSRCHIAMFDENMCEKVIEICTRKKHAFL